jgi:hypothetical protein
MATLTAATTRKLAELDGLAESIEAEQEKLDRMRDERNRLILGCLKGGASERAVAEKARVGYAYVGRVRRGNGDPQAERRKLPRRRKRAAKRAA